MNPPAEAESLARQVLAALSEGDTEAFGELAAEDIEIDTARGVREDHAEADRLGGEQVRPPPAPLRDRGDRAGEGGGVIVRGQTQYVWKHDDVVADSSPVEIELRFDDDGKLTLWRFVD